MCRFHPVYSNHVNNICLIFNIWILCCRLVSLQNILNSTTKLFGINLPYIIYIKKVINVKLLLLFKKIL